MQIAAVCVYFFFRKPLTSQRELATYKDLIQFASFSPPSHPVRSRDARMNFAVANYWPIIYFVIGSVNASRNVGGSWIMTPLGGCVGSSWRLAPDHVVN